MVAIAYAKLLAVAITLILIVVACTAFASLIAWTLGRVGRVVTNDAARYQMFYDDLVTWLDGHGVPVDSVWAEQFNVRWLLRQAHRVTGRIYSTLTFWLITLTYVIWGLLEIDDARRQVQALGDSDATRVLLQGSD